MVLWPMFLLGDLFPSLKPRRSHIKKVYLVVGRFQMCIKVGSIAFENFNLNDDNSGYII